MPIWSWLVPSISFGVLVIASVAGVGAWLAALSGLALLGSVLAAVHHAEVIAHRMGEPLGTLVLALAVTIIEASLIVSMMIAGGNEMATLPRDTIYAAIMIICNGVIGLCLLVGGLAHREQSFRVEGSGAGMAALIAMSVLTLALPTFTTTTPTGTYSTSQLLFVAISSAALWAAFVFMQTISHRDYFIPPSSTKDPQAHAPPPSRRAAWISFVLLTVALVTVVGLAKVLSPAIERAVESAGAPRAVVGIVIAMLVLLPESWAATRAARADRLQSSMNLAIGSALASIGLTIPVVVLAALLYDLPLLLGLKPSSLVMLAVTFLVAPFTVGTGRTHMMQGAVHLVLFAAFLVLAIVP